MARTKHSQPIAVEPAKLICGFLYRHRDLYISALEKLESLFGGVEFESEIFEFSHTDYYEKEMGADLQRCFVSFEKPIDPGRLRDLKISCNDIERQYLNDAGGRTINIDPGLISLAHLALASTKDFAHRLYLGEGIYGEVSMLYEDKTFTALPWTYPDYRTPEVVKFLLRVRESLKEHIISLRQNEQ
jgi:hypothetical protein